jgi:hypothetical protein
MYFFKKNKKIRNFSTLSDMEVKPTYRIIVLHPGAIGSGPRSIAPIVD